MLANILTLSRLFLLAICVGLLYQPAVAAQAAAFALVLLIIFIDAIDGTVARKRGKATALGAILDIAIDRVVENVFWVVFADLDLVPMWVALLFITRGILTDAVRGYAMAQGLTPFAMMQTKWGRWLVSHRFMRALSGVTKVVTFAALAALNGLSLLWAGTAQARYLPILEAIIFVLVLLTVAVNLARGIPVLVESRRFFKGTGDR